MHERIEVNPDVMMGKRVILMRGETAQQNQAVMHYWRTHPAALKAYEQGKYRHTYSRREYYWWKDNLIADILGSL